MSDDEACTDPFCKWCVKTLPKHNTTNVLPVTKHNTTNVLAVMKRTNIDFEEAPRPKKKQRVNEDWEPFFAAATKCTNVVFEEAPKRKKKRRVNKNWELSFATGFMDTN
jgi:hypothetical protein